MAMPAHRPPEVAIPVSLRDRIQTDVTAAMRSGDALRRDVLRMAQNAVYLVEKRDQRTLGDEEIGAILTEYLPEQLDDAAISALVDEAIAATGASNARDMGKVMGWLAPRTKGRADGRRVSERVAAALAQADLAAHATAGHGPDGG